MDKKPKIIYRVFLAVMSALFLVLTSGLALAQTNADTNFNVNVDANINSAPDAVPSVEPITTEIDELNQQIEAKRQHIDELKRQTQIYERQLEGKQNERASLQSELRILEDTIGQTAVALKLNQAEIESLQLEIRRIERDIVAREYDIAAHRDELASLLRRLYETDQTSQLELVVQEQTFSSFFSRVQNLHALSTSIEEALNRVLETKRKLEAGKEDLTSKQTALDEKRQELEGQQALLEDQESYKTNLLDATKNSETKYQALLQELKQQAASVDQEIETLIQQVNDRLAARGEGVSFVQPGQLSWPIDTSKGISAYFHDPTYPFRKIFEHPAIDIRTAHGSTVTAAADGVVAIARKVDWVKNSQGQILWSAYNFITIVHGGDLATVYGHLSQVNVSEGDTVKRGQVIGKSGGTPGTAGAGRLTTGPHLHFEVRVNGIPDDPLKYLPPG